ncbi:MAG: helix-turn-helix transcriptional regulator [Chitinophaga sp.]|uniref:type II toxin-antitoxin system Y4mF family antitoxin n=1 Tax=Chitinophaga sp. TaxID=1869181 RepID=UPI0025BEFA53|nr:type II toxin-antitoxin system Y4mF family antitoxin [Chitinophaga sp.]MBV8255426.1 helix-turn-helix transcriptional regulator [Chitinophaga sp.]
MKYLAELVKQKRKETGLNQIDFADRAGVALTVIRKIEQGKTDLQLEKVIQVLRMFGYKMVPIHRSEITKIKIGVD